MAKKKPKKLQFKCGVRAAEDVGKFVPPGSVNLIVNDPPYNIGQEYADYDDNKKTPDYLAWSQDWVKASYEALHAHGSMFVFISAKLVSELDVVCKRVGFHKRGHIIWHYTFGPNSSKSFTPSSTHILYYTKAKTRFTFNADDPALRIPSARQLKYNDKRANPKGRLPNDTWVLLPEQMPEAFDPAGDVWLESRVCGTFHERKDHSPNQLPEPIVERIVRAASNPGDMVMDQFLGTGTTGVVCRRLRRNFIGVDISALCVEQSRKRIGEATS